MIRITILPLPLVSAVLLAQLAHAQAIPSAPQPSSPFAVTYGLRLGTTVYSFRPTTDRRGWYQSSLEPQLKATGSVFAEISIWNGALRLRTDVWVISHQQHYKSFGGTLNYRAVEAFARPTFLIRCGHMPLYLNAGLECNQVLASRVQGTYQLADSATARTTTQFSVNQPYRPAHTFTLRPTFGLSLYFRSRVDLTLLASWGGHFRAFAPQEPSGGGGGFSIVGASGAPWLQPTTNDFRKVRLIGYQLSLAYHFGQPPAYRGPWHLNP